MFISLLTQFKLSHIIPKPYCPTAMSLLIQCQVPQIDFVLSIQSLGAPPLQRGVGVEQQQKPAPTQLCPLEAQRQALGVTRTQRARTAKMSLCAVVVAQAVWSQQGEVLPWHTAAAWTNERPLAN